MTAEEISTVYVKGTKAYANTLLNAGQWCLGWTQTITDEWSGDVATLNPGTVVKFFTSRDYAGTPIARWYGTIARTKDGKVCIK